MAAVFGSQFTDGNDEWYSTREHKKGADCLAVGN
jgi:hypothetical protein